MRRSTASGGRTAGLPGGFPLGALLLAVGLLVPLLAPGSAAADQVGTSKARAAGLAAQLQALNQHASQLAEAYDQARIHLDDTTARLNAAKAALGRTDSALSGARARVRDMAVEQYVQGGAVRQLTLLIPSSATEIAVRGTYVRSVTASTNDAVDALHQADANLARLQAQLTAAQADASRAISALQSAQKAAEASSATVAAAFSSAQAQLGRDELAQAQADQAAAEQARVAQQLAAPRSAGRVGALGGGIPRSGGAGRGAGPIFGGLPVSAVPLPPPGPGAASAIAFARAEMGKPYVYGGGGPDAFDCSGLTAWAWGHAGHPLPHSSEAQYYDTTHVSVSELQPGDLVFWGMPPHHVGLYVGGGMMLDALHSGTVVQYDSIYMESDLIGGGRVN